MTGPILFCLACRTKAAAGFQKAVARLLARREKELRQAYVVSVHGQKLEEPEQEIAFALDNPGVFQVVFSGNNKQPVPLTAQIGVCRLRGPSGERDLLPGCAPTSFVQKHLFLPGAGLFLSAEAVACEYLLCGKPLTLKAGKCTLTVAGGAAQGRCSVGVLDMKRDCWVCPQSAAPSLPACAVGH